MSKTTVVPEMTGEDRPDHCEGCDSATFEYRPNMGVYACEGCHDKAVRAYMGVFE